MVNIPGDIHQFPHLLDSARYGRATRGPSANKPIAHAGYDVAGFFREIGRLGDGEGGRRRAHARSRTYRLTDVVSGRVAPSALTYST